MVIKRDGSKVNFDIEKIKEAIKKAFLDCEYPDNKTTRKRIDKITSMVLSDPAVKYEDVSVEDIQEVVETTLMSTQFYDVAKAYIRYRDRRNVLRDQKMALKLSAKNIENQNANVDEASFGGRIGEASRIITKDYALNHCMSKRSRNNHLNNEIYIHDLDSYAVGMHNCLSIPFDDLLAKGFKTRQTDVRPANSINTAFQLVAVLFQLQSLQQFGGVSATHLDWTMVPYVKKSFYKHWKEGLKYIKDSTIENFVGSDEYSIDDYPKCVIFDYAMDMTIKELNQAVEGMYHNLNTLQSRSGNQLPFTSINYGTCTSTEGRMVIKALLDGSIKGVGSKHKTPIFPCGIFQYMKGVNDKEGTPNYDLFRLALKSTAKRIYPNYANVDWSGNKGYDRNDPRTYFSTMGCRTANGWDINGFGQLKDGRGNICPVTIIMPTLAMKANRDVETFMNLLDVKIKEAKDMLIERFDYIREQPAESAKFMYENNTMAGYVPEEGLISALKHGTLAIGQLGLAETLQLLIGKDHTTDEGMVLAKRIEELFKTKCAEYKEKYKLNFGVYYTPAENLCHTALLKFREKYGIIPNVSDRDYFTNSIHVPVWKDIDLFKKIDIESQLTGYSSAGCITYVELPNSAENNIDAVETIVTYMMDKDIPYAALNFKLDYCNNCDSVGSFNGECPYCGSTNIDELRRVTGYLSTTKKNFNIGKQKESDDRVEHINKSIL